jgi:hypothetical protein
MRQHVLSQTWFEPGCIFLSKGYNMVRGRKEKGERKEGRGAQVSESIKRELISEALLISSSGYVEWGTCILGK